jgi:hypothetical protein
MSFICRTAPPTTTHDDEAAGAATQRPVLHQMRDVGCPTSTALQERTVRTTLAIDDDVLAAAKSLAERQRKTVGEVISALARRGLQGGTRGGGAKRNGIALLPTRKAATPVTMELVNQLRDELS